MRRNETMLIRSRTSDLALTNRSDHRYAESQLSREETYLAFERSRQSQTVSDDETLLLEAAVPKDPEPRPIERPHHERAERMCVSKKVKTREAMMDPRVPRSKTDTTAGKDPRNLLLVHDEHDSEDEIEIQANPQGCKTRPLETI